MTTPDANGLHSCSYYCTIPMCIKAQRDEMRKRFIEVAMQEPVAWMVYSLDGTSVCVTDNPADFTDRHQALPLYTAPQPHKPWVGLTDDEIKEIIGPWGDVPIKGYTRKLFDQIEAKLKELNS